MRIPLVGQSYVPDTLAAGAQASVNFFPEPIEDPNENQKGNAILIGCPGKHLFKDLTAIDAGLTPLRGIFYSNGRVWVAAGTKYCEISPAGALVGSVRTIADDADHSPVTFFANGTQLFIVSAGTAYVDIGSGPTALTLPAFTGEATGLGLFTDWVSGDYFDPGMVGQNFTIAATTKVVAQVLSPTTLTVTVTWGASPVTGAYSCSPTFQVLSGAYLDGYFLASRKASSTNLAQGRQFNWSPLQDGSNAGTYAWDPLDFAQKESYPDYILSLLVCGEQLYIFGTESFEVWQNAGNGDSPFVRIDGATGRFGVSSPWSAIAIGGRVYFHATNSEGRISAYVMEGFTPRRVSTYAQEVDWQGGFGSTVVSVTYFEEGHHFWGMDNGSAGTQAFTWFYDISTGMWHQRSKYVASAFAAYGMKYHAFASNSTASTNDWSVTGKHLVGGDGTGKVYDQSLAFFDDVSTDMKQQRALPYQYNEGKLMFFGRNDLEMQTGTVASGAAPVVTRDYSDDRGQTFINPVTASLGVHNDYSKRVFWAGSSASRGRVYRYSFIGQSKIVLVGAYLDRKDGVV